MRAVRYDRFSGIDALYLADIPEPAPAAGEVVVEVEAAALNPGALPALHGAPFVPNRDLTGRVVSVGEDVTAFTAGDAVLGWLQSWDAHAPRVAVPADQLVPKPAALPWDVAGSLYTTPMAAAGAVQAVAPGVGDLLVISGASGGVGFVAAQIAVRAGARVIGLTSARHTALLQQHGVEPVRYGDGEHDRLRAAAGDQQVTAFIDAVGEHYIDLALTLGIAHDRINTVVDYRGAQVKGVKALGTRDAGGLPTLADLARQAADGQLTLPIGAGYPLTRVQDAYRALADRRTFGRIVLHPQELTSQ